MRLGVRGPASRALMILSALAGGCSPAARDQPARDVAACARASDGLDCAAWTAGRFSGLARWSTAFGFGEPWKAGLSFGSGLRSPDLDGDGRADACLHDGAGLQCALRTASESFGPVRRSFVFTDDQEGGYSSHASSLDFADVDGDGLPDACARGASGLSCAHGRGDGTFEGGVLWSAAPFATANGGDLRGRERRLRFADVDGDGRADVCVPSADGVLCALSQSVGFAAPRLWTTSFGDSDGASGATELELVDVDGDGRADICGHVGDEVRCALSDGRRFVDSASLADAAPGAAVRFADVDGDRRSDVCVIDDAAVRCARSFGNGFTALAPWHRALPGTVDSLTLVDVNADGRSDLCQRGAQGLSCALSDGARFADAGGTVGGLGLGSIPARDIPGETLTIGSHVAADDAATLNRTAVENQQTGAEDWWIPYPQWSINHEIEAYTDQLSYAAGAVVNVRLSTATSGDGVSWRLLRTGWYGGRGARDIASGRAVGYPQPLPLPGASDVVRAAWNTTFSFTLPTDAVSGIYVLRLDSRTTNKSFFVTFVVREDDRVADLIFDRADFTDEAYNSWDGGPNSSSAYQGALWVSFDRPLRSVGALGVYSYSSGYFVYEYPMVRWLEAQGYDVTYVSDVDVHASAAVLAHGRAFLSVGHDEYWSAAMRDHVEAARDRGLHLGFFGSDMVDGLIRFKRGDARTFSRTISNRDTRKNQFATKPLDLSRPAHDNPSDELTGTHYVSWCAAVHPSCRSVPQGKLLVADDYEIAESSHPIFRGIDATRMQEVLGYEYEALFADPEQLPFALHVLGRAVNLQVGGQAPVMVAYQAQSGSRVVNLGSMHWAHALDPWTGRAAFRTSGGERDCAPAEDDCFVRSASPAAQVTANILADFGATPSTPSPGLLQTAGETWP